MPPPQTGDATVHLLQPPKGAHPVRMRWIARERAWEADNGRHGRRMAFTANYLGSHGWEYVGPAN